MFLNNIAQLVSSLGGGGSPAVYVSVFSVSSCVAAFSSGATSHPRISASHRSYHSRTWYK